MLHQPQGAKLIVRGGHLSSRCEIPVRAIDFLHPKFASVQLIESRLEFRDPQALNFTLMAWFTYGLAEADEHWYGDELEAGGDPGPSALEQRLPAQFEPELASTGKPDLIVLNSVYWDLRYFSRKARHERWSSGELQDSVRPLSWHELRWYRHRLGDMVELFRERFPDVPLMYRTGAAVNHPVTRWAGRTDMNRSCSDGGSGVFGRSTARKQPRQGKCRSLPDQRQREIRHARARRPHLSL